MSKAEKTRYFIIEKTAPIFNRKGFSGTSITDLTEATGLTKGSIYGNFTDKDEVAIEALKYNLNLIINAVKQEKDNCTNSVELLMAYTKAHRKFHDEIQQRGGCPLLNTLTEADDTHGELSRIASTMIKQWKREMVMIANNGKKLNEIKPETDTAVLAETIITLIEGGSFLTKSTGEKSYMKNAIDTAERLINEITLNSAEPGLSKKNN